MPVGAAIGSAVGALGGGVASMMGANAQASAANQAAANQMAMYKQTRSDLLPFMQGGAGAFAGLSGLAPGMTQNLGSSQNMLANLLGLNGGNPQSMLSSLEQTPGYQFAFGQGEQALDRSAASRGLLLSGGQVKDATNYGQGMASQLYQQTIGNLTGYGQNQFSNLSNMANLGENAAAQSGAQGQTAASQAGQFSMSGAQATAGGYMGMANAFGGPNGVFQNALNAYQLAYPSGGGGNAGFNGVTPQFYDPTTGLSDRRLKTDIVRVGTLDSGLPVYSYRFKGSTLPQMGVMADEVRRVDPGAVHRGRDGFDRVDYRRVSQLPAFKEAA